MGPYLYRIAFQPLSEASILVLLDRGGGRPLLHDRALPACSSAPRACARVRCSRRGFAAGPIPVSGQNIAICLAAVVQAAALYYFFDRTILGKALRATAVNRLGARLVGVRTALSGQLAFLIAAAMGAFCRAF